MSIETDAKKLLDDAKKLRAKGEPKDAPPAPSAEKIKTKEELEKEKVDNLKATEEAKKKADVDAEAKKKVDKEAEEKREKELLAKKDEELDEEGKKKKSELVKRDRLNKRFGELTGQVKDLTRVVEEKGKETVSERKKREALETELGDLKKQLSMTPDDLFRQSVKEELSGRRSKYIKEDAKLPREDKREMTKEELDAWRDEDYEGVTDWIARRGVRRMDEEKEFANNARLDKVHTNLLKSQKESEKKTFEKHPELNFHERSVALEKEGKDVKEIHEILVKENPKYKVAQAILMENPEKYLLSENGPELIMAEMEKRMGKADETNELAEIKKELAEIKAENQRLAGLDTTISSTRASESKEEPELTVEAKKLAKEVGLDPEKVANRIKKRKGTGGRS